MTPHEFIAKWKDGGDERRDAQPFFEDLCRLVRHQTPREADPEHTWFTYEYGASKTDGGDGWADVWKKGFFGWEAKGTHKSLERAYAQLKMYADALQNPPLLVVSDLHTIIVHTNFTNTAKREYRFTIEELADHKTREILEAAFHNPERLRPGETRTSITKDAAEKFSTLAQSLRNRGHDPHAVAHFLNRLIFCMFAEDIRLLPNELFTKMVNSSQGKPDLFEKRASELFAAMKAGGDVAFENIEWFNGGLFEDDTALRLEGDELAILASACRMDWSEIDPSIFGTLFERGLDPDKRSQLGAHYTDPDTIMKIIRPVVIEPWLREWEEERKALATMVDRAKKTVSKAAMERFNRFLERLRAFRVLDPACGSGNFLFLSLHALKNIEARVIAEGEMLGLPRQFPGVGPQAVKGIELNAYAAELARITIWIGEIQWMIQNGYGAKKNPILQPLDQIENRDALLNDDGTEATWPHADAVVGNPPFIGSRKLNKELGSSYVETVRKAYGKRVPNGADFVCYWFEKARAAIQANHLARAGLVGTQAIRAGRSREVLRAIIETTKIGEAWSDEPWVNEGAAVRVSIVCYGNGFEGVRLNGASVSSITADLSSGDRGFDLTKAKKLRANRDVAFQGIIPRGAFVVNDGTAARWAALPTNPNGLTNAAVMVPYVNANHILKRTAPSWCLDFGQMEEAEAMLFEQPYAYAKAEIYPERQKTNQQEAKDFWWQHWCPRPEMNKALERVDRYIATPRVAKFRVFTWLEKSALPDSRLYAIARDDSATFGILHSRAHEVWAMATSSRHGDGTEGGRPTYNAASCFETFPFPEGMSPNIPAASYSDDPRAQRIAAVAQALVDARDRWLNPPEWIDRVPEVVPGYPDRIVAKPGHEADLKKRTLTNLYNARPAWLQHAHQRLDEAVAAAYGWQWPLSDEEILRRLFELNQSRAVVGR